MANFHISIGDGKSIAGEFEAKCTAGETISIDVDSAGSLVCLSAGVELRYDHNLEVEEGETKGTLTCKAAASGWFKWIYTAFNADGPGHFTADGFDEVKQDKKPKPADLIPKILFSPASLKFFGSNPKGTTLTTKAWVTGSAEESTPTVQSTGSIAPITLSASGQQGTAELVKPDHPHEIRTSFVATAVAVKRIYAAENPSNLPNWPVESEERVNLSADCLVIFSPTEEGATVIVSTTTWLPTGVGNDATVELIRPQSHPLLSPGLIYYVYKVTWTQTEYLIKEKRNATTGALIEVVSKTATGKTLTQTKTMTGSYYYSGQSDPDRKSVV